MKKVLCTVGTNSRRASVERNYAYLTISGKKKRFAHNQKAMITDSDFKDNRKIIFVPGIDSKLLGRHGFRLIGDYGADKPIEQTLTFKGVPAFKVSELCVEFLQSLTFDDLIRFIKDNFGSDPGLPLLNLKKADIISGLIAYLTEKRIDVTSLMESYRADENHGDDAGDEMQDESDDNDFDIDKNRLSDYLGSLRYRELINFVHDNFGDDPGVPKSGMKGTRVINTVLDYVHSNNIDISGLIPDDFSTNS